MTTASSWQKVIRTEGKGPSALMAGWRRKPTGRPGGRRGVVLAVVVALACAALFQIFVMPPGRGEPRRGPRDSVPFVAVPESAPTGTAAAPESPGSQPPGARSESASEEAPVGAGSEEERGEPLPLLGLQEAMALKFEGIRRSQIVLKWSGPESAFEVAQALDLIIHAKDSRDGPLGRLTMQKGEFVIDRSGYRSSTSTSYRIDDADFFPMRTAADLGVGAWEIEVPRRALVRIQGTLYQWWMKERGGMPSPHIGISTELRKGIGGPELVGTRCVE